MSERQIVVVDMGSVFPGMFICDVDADYPHGSAVPASDYDVEEQDWQRVASRKGHADIADYVLEGYDGTPHVYRGWQASASVWVLCEDGMPVIQDDPNY